MTLNRGYHLLDIYNLRRGGRKMGKRKEKRKGGGGRGKEGETQSHRREEILFFLLPVSWSSFVSTIRIRMLRVVE